MKVNYINKDGDIVTKEIDFNFSNLSESDYNKAFKECKIFVPNEFIFKDIQNCSVSEIQQIFKNCKT